MVNGGRINPRFTHGRTCIPGSDRLAPQLRKSGRWGGRDAFNIRPAGIPIHGANIPNTHAPTFMVTCTNSAARINEPAGETVRGATRCWVISDAAAGNRRQARALGDALGLECTVHCIHARQPWDALAPRMLAGAKWAIRDHNGNPLQPPWPDVAIGCGRRAALALRALRRWSRDRCFCVQILDPRVDPREFDVVIAPAHDRLHGENVITSIGALNPVNAAWLAEGCRQFPVIGELVAPRCTVLIGASHRTQQLDRAYFDALLSRLQQRYAATGGSFLVSTSRRTPADLATWLRERFSHWPGLFWANDCDGDNPYAGLLGWADCFIVTPDSVNMLSEACATGKPVSTFATGPLRGKLARFHALLHERGHLHGLDASAQITPPLQETAAIAANVRERFQQYLARR